MFKEIIGYGNHTKKIQAEMKFALSEIEKNPQETNSRRDEAEIQMNDLEHKEEKKHSLRTRRRKMNSKKQG